MTIYEPEDFDNIWQSEEMKRNRAVDKLKKIRKKQKEDDILWLEDRTPTSLDIEKWFRMENDE